MTSSPSSAARVAQTTGRLVTLTTMLAHLFPNASLPYTVCIQAPEACCALTLAFLDALAVVPQVAHHWADKVRVILPRGPEWDICVERRHQGLQEVDPVSAQCCASWCARALLCSVSVACPRQVPLL